MIEQTYRIFLWGKLATFNVSKMLQDKKNKHDHDRLN